jgi:hypothetical protein
VSSRPLINNVIIIKAHQFLQVSGSRLLDGCLFLSCSQQVAKLILHCGRARDALQSLGNQCREGEHHHAA